MNLREAIKALYEGYKVALPEWGGYWFIENGAIRVYTKDGEYKDTPWFSKYADREDWKVVGNELITFDFGHAIQALRNGRAIQRKGWNGKGLFVVKQIPCKLEGLIIDKIQSLPQSAKELLKKREGVPTLAYTNQMLIINPDGRADSWVPSASDVFAEDWSIVG